MERRDLTARQARDRLAALLELRPSQLARINQEQAVAMADELATQRIRRASLRRQPTRRA